MNPSESMLTIDNITMNFGGMTALNGVSAELRRGEILGLIGPNGAGKTTLFNVISGMLNPSFGKVYLKGTVISKMIPSKICRYGIGRTFQIVRPFNSMTIRENVAVGSMAGGKSVPQAMEKADEILESINMLSLADKMPASLTLSEKKRIEVARALATEPEILLLDEVMAGLNLNEIQEFTDFIKNIHSKGISMVIVEHVMQAVMLLCSRVIVLNFGEILAEGTPQEVINDPKVVTAYLGEGYHAEN